jgi:hypothetical protein
MRISGLTEGGVALPQDETAGGRPD